MLKNNIFSKSNRVCGFTIIELVITLSILGIVIVMLSDFFSFNIRTFNKGEDRAAVQFDVRMASDYITEELRNVSLISTSNNALTNTMNLSSLQSKYPLVNSVSFDLVLQDAKYFVVYTVNGNSSNGQNPYSVNTRVLLNNITSATLGTSVVIYYTK